MATSRKSLRESVKANYVNLLTDFLTSNGEEILRVGSNEIAFPVTDSEGNEDFMVITCKIPTGSKGDNGTIEPYDGYAMAQDYELKLRDKADKAKKTAEQKAKKIERDKKYRERKAQQKEQREVK